MDISVPSIGLRAGFLLALLSAPIALASAQDTASPQSGSQPSQARMEKGQKLYMEQRCFACHGQFGFGAAGPRFRDDKFLGLTDYVVGQILLGRSIMPAYGQTLSDQQVADVATYIRNSWGNEFGVVQPQQVGDIRKQASAQSPQNQPQATTQSSGPPPTPPGPGTIGQQNSPSEGK